MLLFLLGMFRNKYLVFYIDVFYSFLRKHVSKHNNSALSDTIGQKIVFQYLLFAQLLTVSYYLIIVQFELSPWLWPYGGIFWTLGGGYASLLAVAFSVVTAKAPIGTPLRWIAILSMEAMIQLGSCSMVSCLL